MTPRLLHGFVAAALVVAIGGWLRAQDVDLEVAFRAATETETVKGDLKAAIEQYRSVANGGNRNLAARALMRMAECYQKLGDEEARRIYERVAREFADYGELAREARARADVLGTSRADARVIARQIWVGEDVDIEGKPSADGRYLAFVDWRSSDTGNVAVRDLQAGVNRRLTNAGLGEGYAYEPVVSSDGRSIAYLWYGEDGTSVRIVSTTGGAPRVVRTEKHAALYYLQWSPEGRTFAVAMRDNDRDDTWRIGLIDANGGALTTLKSTAWDGPQVGGFSSDGRFLVYALSHPTSTESVIFAIAVDGSQETVLQRSTANDRAPVWSHDGRAVVFVSDRSGTEDLWSIPVSAGKATGEPTLVRRGVGNIANIGFAKDGTYYYGTRNGSTDVYLADFDPETGEFTGNKRRLSDRFVGSNKAPAWSPDGRWIAFVRGVRSSGSLVIRSVATGQERTLSLKLVDWYAAGAFGPVWLPDSRSLLVPETDYDNRATNIHKIDVETERVDTVVRERHIGIYPHVRISPSGDAIFFTRRDRRIGENESGFTLRLMRRDLGSGHEVELYRSEGPGVGFFGLALSPDGARVSFMANVGTKGDRHLISVPAVGGPPQILYKGNYLHPLPWVGVWTRNGRYILGAAEETKSMRRIWAFPANGGEPRKLNLLFESLTTTDVSPDGKQIAFTGTMTKSEVWTIKNLLQP